MADGGLIDSEELRSARTRPREVRGELLTGPERRRRWSLEEKLRILAQSVAPGSSASLACRMHGISSGQLYTWRRQFRTGELTGFAAVTVAPSAGQLATPAASAALASRPEADPPIAGPIAGMIEVELSSGVKLRLTGPVDMAMLRQVLSALS